MKKFLFTIVSLCFIFSIFAQDTITNKEGSNYQFSVIIDLETTAVKNQGRTGTCWSFSTVSFLESELLREGKGRHFLSPMFVVRKAYIDKAKMYVRMHGKFNFSPGGEPYDIPYIYKKYGMMPNEAYPGLLYGDTTYNQNELDGVLKAMLDVYIKNPGGKLSKSWEKSVNDVLDNYLGKVPEEFSYNGKKYTPQSYAKELGLNMDDYVSITSFTHHPFYSEFVLEIPDNWQLRESYNVPLNEMLDIIDNSIQKGYSIAWAADVSEKGFSFSNGLAIVPEDPSTLKKPSEETPENKYAFTQPVPEIEITQEIRQDAFDNYTTTDDHAMQITGMVKDQEGNIYYKVKNSWGTKNYSKGYFYASRAYVKYKTISVNVNKAVISKDIKNKLNIQ